MNKFEYSLDTDLVVMQKYGLTPNEWLVTKVILLYQDGNLGYFSSLLQLDFSLNDVLQSLVTKGVIKPFHHFDPGEVKIKSGKFSSFYRSAFVLGRELFSCYPMFGIIDGVRVSLRGIAKRFSSLEDFFDFYGKEISWSPSLHAEVLELIEWDKLSNTHYLNMSISSFVIEHKWEELRILRDSGSGYVDMFESL